MIDVKDLSVAADQGPTLGKQVFEREGILIVKNLLAAPVVDSVAAFLHRSLVRVEDALGRVEWSTLFFFLGLFVMVGALVEQGVVADVADALTELTGDSSVAEGMVILWGSALGSALVDNIPFTTAMLPVVDSIQGEEFDDGLWWALALGACFGGNATLIAAAANVAAVSALARTGTRISFVQFLVVGLPITFLSLLIATAYLLAFQL